MKCAIRRKYGSPNQIIFENIEKPIPKDNEVLIKVYATTVNRTDCVNLTARPFIMRFVLGIFRPKKINHIRNRFYRYNNSSRKKCQVILCWG